MRPATRRSGPKAAPTSPGANRDCGQGSSRVRADEGNGSEVLVRLDAIAALGAYALLGMLPLVDVLEGVVVLAHRAALFLVDGDQDVDRLAS